MHINEKEIVECGSNATSTVKFTMQQLPTQRRFHIIVDKNLTGVGLLKRIHLQQFFISSQFDGRKHAFTVLVSYLNANQYFCNFGQLSSDQ